MTQSSLPALNGVADLNVAPFRKGARDALNALREVTDFAKKNGTMTLTAKLAGTSVTAMRQQISAAVAGQALPVRISFDPASVQAAVHALRATLTAVVGINTSVLTAVQVQINAQIQTLQGLIQQLRALGSVGGTGGGRGGAGAGLSANTQGLLSQLEALNNEYKRGDVSADFYARRLTQLQAQLRLAAAGATAGSAEFRALDRAVTQTTQGLRNVDSAKITALKTELQGARAQFDAAAAAATNLAQRRAAIAAYEGELNRIKVALQAMAQSGNLTAAQLGQVNRELARIAREGNTIRGGINIGGLSGNITTALQQLTSFVPGLGMVNGLLGEMNPAMMGVAAGALALAAGFAASFRTAAQFQQVMVDIKALTQPTAEGFAQLSEGAKTIGAELGVGPRAAAAAILELNRAGLTATDTLNGGLTGALTLAGAAGIEAAKASNLAAAAMTAFALSAEDMPAIADTFANFSNKTFLGAEDLSQAIAAVGPVAKSAGLDLNEFAGYMATLAQGGFKNMSDAGTSLKTMLLSLQAPSETATGALERLKLNVYDSAGGMRPLNEVLDELRGKLKNLSEQDRNAALKNIFGTDGIRAATIFMGDYNLSLDENSRRIEENIKAMGLQGEAARVARERMETYEGAVKQLSASWESFKITVGEKFLPVATDIVKALKSGVDAIGEFGNGTHNLVPYIAPLIGAFVALRGAALAAAAPAIWAALLTAIGGFFTTVNAWVASNPFGAIALAVSALAMQVNKIMQETQAVYDQVDAANQASFEKTMKRVRELTAEDTELSRTQAKLLLALQTLQQAQEGDLKGVNMWGERIYQVDPEKVKAAQQRVQELQQELGLLRQEAQRHGRLDPKKTAPGGEGLSPEQTKKREEALRDLRKTLDERAFELKVEGMSELDAELARTGREFDQLRIKIKAAFGGNLNNTELQAQLRALTTQQEAEQAAIRAKFRKDEAEQREKDAQAAAKSLRAIALEMQRAEIAAMQEGADKKAAERQLELDQMRQNVADQVKEFSKAPQLQAAAREAGRRQEAALRQQWAAEDLKAAQDAAQAALTSERAARDASIALIQDGNQRRAAERQRDLEDLRRSVADQAEALTGQPEAQARVQAAGRAQEAALRRQWAQEDVQLAKERADKVAAAEREARDAVIAAIQDEGQRRAAERSRDLEDLRQSVAERVRELKGYPSAQARIEEAGHRQIAALRAGWAQQDEREARERATRIAEAWMAVQEAQAQAEDARRNLEAARYELDLSRRVAALKGNAVAIAQVEADAVRERARLAEQAAQAQANGELRRLAEGVSKKLSLENLSAQERLAIQRQYEVDVAAVQKRYDADAYKRLREREQAEQEAAEKIRAARIAAAFQPAEDAARRVQDLEREMQLARNAADRLDIQRRLTAEQASYAAELQSALSSAASLALTDEERRTKTDQLKDAQLKVELSKRQEVELSRQLVTEAQDLVRLYGNIGTLLGDDSGGAAAAQRDLEASTRDLADAYAKAAPVLERFRDGSLKPQDYADATEAMQGLITALEDQKRKLEALRTEYDRQRSALSSLQDVLRGFGQEFGDENLLNNAISFNQGTYDQAKAALDALLKGGQYDAAQLAEATKDLQASYGGLKDSVLALGDARAKEHEKEAARLKREADDKTRVLDAQIKAAKAKGTDTADLERQRDAITTQLELKVRELEGKADAARKAAQDSLTSRTGGLQQLLQGVQAGATKAQQGVTDLGAQVKRSEADVKASAARMKASLTSTFAGLPALAGQAGQDAGRRFMQQLQQQLKAVKMPDINVSGGAKVSSTGGGTSVVNLYYNGQKMPDSQDLRQLARELTPLIRSEAQRRNGGSGPCGGAA